LGLLVFFGAATIIHSGWLHGFTITVVAGTTAVLINYVVQGNQTPLDILLNWRPVIWIGQLSYSLYLWQQMFCLPSGTQWFKGFPQNLLLTLLAALASFYLIELPTARWRSRIKPRPRIQADAAGAVPQEASVSF
ncbi:MAG: hypothetical protein WCI73_15420, partial [Phycisphaerae bacterium]